MPPLETLLPFLAQSGVFSLIVWWIRHTHKDAIAAHDKRATEWKTAYEEESARNDELQKQLLHILGAVKTSTGTT